MHLTMGNKLVSSQYLSVPITRPIEAQAIPGDVEIVDDRSPCKAKQFLFNIWLAHKFVSKYKTAQVIKIFFNF